MQSLSISSFDLCAKDGEKYAFFHWKKKYPAICKKYSPVPSLRTYAFMRFTMVFGVVWQKIPSKSLQSNIDGWAGNLFWTPKRSKDRSSFVGPAFHTKYIILDSYILYLLYQESFWRFILFTIPIFTSWFMGGA